MPSTSRTRRQDSPKPREGCLTHGLACLVACVLLVVNGAAALSLYEYFRNDGPKFLAEPKVAQAIMFAAPIIMILFEWWIFDLLFGRRQTKATK